MNDWRYFDLIAAARRCAPDGKALLRVRRLLDLIFGAGAATGTSALEVSLWPHYLFGDAVGFLLMFVSRSVERRFRLYRSRQGHPAEIARPAR
ncbi:MAG TPA: hypothetical protein VMU45_14310 [Candidatus Eisenbacteria bacterium]|nr:hypothetical protein [Candidatus Eisenbacteria bacterium]